MDAIIKFRDDRDWQEGIDLKDVAIATSLEVAELLEHFKWKNKEEMQEYLKMHKKDVEEEIMDVLFNALLLASELKIDFDKAFFEKMKKNEEKYPVKKVKGKNPHL